MKTKLQTLIIRFADSDHKTCGINSLYVMVSTRPRSWCQHAPMASTSRNACINSPHVMVSTHLESWYQLAPGHGINLPQVKLTRWMEVIQWIFMHEILQNIADNVQKCAMNDGLCENVRWTENCVENGNLCDIALAALKYCLCNWYRSIRAVSSTSHHRIAQSTGGYFSMIKSMPRERERLVYYSHSGTMWIVHLLMEMPSQLLLKHTDTRCVLILMIRDRGDTEDIVTSVLVCMVYKINTRILYYCRITVLL